MNIYDLINEELKRMYTDRDHNLAMAKNGQAMDGRFIVGRNYEYVAESINTNITAFRSIILGAFAGRDEKIQNVIAELALTGDHNEKSGI